MRAFPATECCGFWRGDVNADGHLDMEDGAAIVWIYLYEEEEEKKG